MSISEIKQEINAVINNMPEETLSEVLSYMKTIEKISADKIKLSSDVRKILYEDRELLQKLAK